MTTELGYNNDDFVRDRMTILCKDGLYKSFCSFPSNHPVVDTTLYIRVVDFKMRRVSKKLFDIMRVDDNRAYTFKINFESIWPTKNPDADGNP